MTAENTIKAVSDLTHSKRSIVLVTAQDSEERKVRQSISQGRRNGQEFNPRLSGEILSPASGLLKGVEQK